ncbi:MAG: efflux RND transporter periplasmic adaptor subunit [Planctomycetes bacterium]|nr:efflux RND transporter periplasmic adaptor subunit [Planctomycetota bacterium]
MLRSRLHLIGLSVLIAAFPATLTRALEFDGFTEPYRTISVASDETGIIAEVLVREGEAVEAGQALARLNSDVYLTSLAIAQQSMQAEGRLDAVSAEMQLRKRRQEKLESLRGDGHARQEEVDRARAETAVAEANVLSAREDLQIKRLEYERIKAQLERRTIRSPIAGVVTELHKQQGEFVAPNNPDILSVVELDPLLANFSLMRPDAEALSVGQKVQIPFPGSNSQVEGVVEFVAPVMDAERGTVRVKVRVENTKGSLRSGERCTLRLPE